MLSPSNELTREQLMNWAQLSVVGTTAVGLAAQKALASAKQKAKHGNDISHRITNQSYHILHSHCQSNLTRVCFVYVRIGVNALLKLLIKLVTACQTTCTRTRRYYLASHSDQDCMHLQLHMGPVRNPVRAIYFCPDSEWSICQQQIF